MFESRRKKATFRQYPKLTVEVESELKTFSLFGAWANCLTFA